MSATSPDLHFETIGVYNSRMKKFLALAFVLVLASAASAQTTWFKGTLDEAVAKAKVEHKLVLVDFYSYT